MAMIRIYREIDIQCVPAQADGQCGRKGYDSMDKIHAIIILRIYRLWENKR